MTITLISLHTAADYVYCSRRKNQIHHCHLRNLKLHPRPLARWFTVTWGSTFTHTSTTSKTVSLAGKRIDTITPRSVCWTTNPSTSTPIRHKSIKWNSTWRCGTKICRRKWSTRLEKRTRPWTRISSRSHPLNRWCSDSLATPASMITTSMSETATNIVIRIIDDSNGVFTDETGRSKEEILNLLKENLLKQSHATIKEIGDKNWESVYWNPDNYRPNVTTNYLNGAYTTNRTRSSRGNWLTNLRTRTKLEPSTESVSKE